MRTLRVRLEGPPELADLFEDHPRSESMVPSIQLPPARWRSNASNSLHAGFNFLFKCSGLSENQFLDQTAVEELLSALATRALQLFDRRRAPRILGMLRMSLG
jgi:hypothetical protein